MRTVRESIFSASPNGTPDQASDVRPTLDALAHAICADVGNRARLGRPLPLPATTKARADELVGASTGSTRPGPRLLAERFPIHAKRGGR